MPKQIGSHWAAASGQAWTLRNVRHQERKVERIGHEVQPVDLERLGAPLSDDLAAGNKIGLARRSATSASPLIRQVGLAFADEIELVALVNGVGRLVPVRVAAISAPPKEGEQRVAHRRQESFPCLRLCMKSLSLYMAEAAAPF